MIMNNCHDRLLTQTAAVVDVDDNYRYEDEQNKRFVRILEPALFVINFNKLQ